MLIDNISLLGQFVVYTHEAGLGRLSVAMEGPSRCDINMQDIGDGSCEVTYSCSQPGMSFISLCCFLTDHQIQLSDLVSILVIALIVYIIVLNCTNI